MKLDDNFLWGSASAACQMEGAFDVDGKSLTVSDLDSHLDKEDIRFNDGEYSIKDIQTILNDEQLNFSKRRGNNFYYKYKEDIQLLSEMGVKAYRFSFSWARIFPDPRSETPNVYGLQFYDNVISECEKYHIEPIVTLSHFDTPLIITQLYGGWCNKEVIKLFLKYCTTIFRYFKNRIKYWMTFNEINAAIEIPFKGAAIPYSCDSSYENKKHQGLFNQFVASALATKELHIIDKNAKMGCMIAAFTTYPETCHPLDVLEALKENRDYYLFADVQAKGIIPKWYQNYLKDKHIVIETTKQEIDEIQNNTVDYISFSYYMSLVTSYDKSKKTGEGNLKGGIENPYLKKTDWGWMIDPVGLRITMNEFYNRYQLPIMISENGFGCYESLGIDKKIHDDNRVAYLKSHIEELKKAILNDGVDCFAYLTWSPIDMISSGSSEMSKRYGFVYVDYDDFGLGTGERVKKDSFQWYAQVIQSNGETL